MIGIGIDTGGTYTDAVIYDLEKGMIVDANKALTTKRNLQAGIENVLEKLDKEKMKKCEMLALSTTLATNACVENKGGRAKLILIGVEEKTFLEVHKDYGIENPEDVYILPCKIDSEINHSEQPDWNQFEDDLDDLVKSCDCISVVQLFSKAHSGSYEKKAAQYIKNKKDMPVILGCDLFYDLNAIKRGAGALLNARLIPVIYDFLEAVKKVFGKYKIKVPTVIVRSDGSLMTEKIAMERPVETLLCGPAASIKGAQKLSEEKNALVIDMGGTTTDIAIIKDGQPVRAENGIQIGNWKTFVKGLYVETFGLGGDTAVHYDYDGNIYLENYRVIPLCSLASNYPGVMKQLQEIDESERCHTYPIYEFLCLQNETLLDSNYSEKERLLCENLKEGPLTLENAAKSIGTDIYNLHTEKLEKNGILMRSGITPTDIMHIKGDFTTFHTEASYCGVRSIARYGKKTVEMVCNQIYDLVYEKLYTVLVKILLKQEYSYEFSGDWNEQMERLLHLSYENCKKGEKLPINISFHTPYVLVGVGAPTHIFIEKVASYLGTKAVIPNYFHVANAIGAIVGQVSVRVCVEIIPYYVNHALEGYQIVTGKEQFYEEDYEKAVFVGEEKGLEIAKQLVIEQGAQGEIKTRIENAKQESVLSTGTLYLGEKILVTAEGCAFEKGKGQN